MITKGIILSKSGLNKFIVRLPIFETADNKVDNSLENISHYECTLCYTPGIENSYQEGDVVFVGFEDNKLYKPIILGKLYLSEDTSSRAYANLSALNVESSVNLPTNTNFDGLSLSYLKDIVQQVVNLTEQSKEKEETISTYNITTSLQLLENNITLSPITPLFKGELETKLKFNLIFINFYLDDPLKVYNIVINPFSINQSNKKINISINIINNNIIIPSILEVSNIDNALYLKLIKQENIIENYINIIDIMGM